MLVILNGLSVHTSGKIPMYFTLYKITSRNNPSSFIFRLNLHIGKHSVKSYMLDKYYLTLKCRTIKIYSRFKRTLKAQVHPTCMVWSCDLLKIIIDSFKVLYKNDNYIKQ